MIYSYITLLGLILGSFASVIIHRLHTGEAGIIKGRSKCPHCNHRLTALDLIPVLSYLANKGKCRHCKTTIPFRYPLLELSMAGLFFLTAKMVGLENMETLSFYLFISFIFVVLTFYDFLYKEVPDEISLPTIIITLIYVVITGEMTWLSLLLGIAAPVSFFALLYFGSQGRWLGGGDLRIGGLMGALLGWPMILVGLFLGYLTGALYSVSGLALGKFNKKSQIPFAPFLLLGTYLALFWGEQMVAWYRELLF